MLGQMYSMLQKIPSNTNGLTLVTDSWNYAKMQPKSQLKSVLLLFSERTIVELHIKPVLKDETASSPSWTEIVCDTNFRQNQLNDIKNSIH